MAHKLKVYKRKRNFKRTKEPEGKIPKGRGKKLIFVIQEHHARRLHYDFRLEMEGVLKSWAIPKGPSLDPNDKRLAVQTEDHPMEYAKFHGSIPKGEYGGGEVFIWDKGTWEPKSDDYLTWLKKGRLEFTLHGERLKGKFVLIRTNYRGAEGKNWLLKKVRDDKVVKEELSDWPGFIPPQLPRLIASPPVEDGWVHEMKLDGYRMQAHMRDGIVKIFSRSGQDWSNSFPFILEALGKLPVKNAILDGEIVALDEKGRSHFQKLQGAIKDKNDKNLRFYLFDLMYLDGKDVREHPLLERKDMLHKLINDKQKMLLYSEHFAEDGKDFYNVSCEHQLEGMISKLVDSPYLSGRSDLWNKTKCTSRQEFIIGGWTDPKGATPGFGALLLGVYDGNQLRYAGRVGTGFDIKTRRSIYKELQKIESNQSPFDLKSPHGKDIHWVEPEKVCEVSFAQWTEEGILRMAVFQGMRADKPAVEVSEEVAISSPDKILYKKERITKLDVLNFYREIGKDMLPFMANRPLSLVRCPNGTSGQCFFQKHFVGKNPKSFHTFPIEENSGEGVYLSINSVEGLLELTQLNAFEIHAWNCQQDNYHRPDQIVMDLDPGEGVLWKDVIEGAFELKQMLEDLGLKSFVKLTGGKGLHIHVPVAPLYDWDQIKAFSQGLALEMVHRHPEHYVANMAKKVRKNKIFVDYLRNGYGATAVVPYSLRAREMSSVALPVDWKELKKINGPQEFTLKNTLKKIKQRKKDPWEGMMKLAQKIPILEPIKKAA